MFLGYDNPTPTQPVPCGRYLLVERIGYGGMAEVFRAQLPGPHQFAKTVVVKRILPRLLDDKLILQMFIEEAKIAAAADHDNIAKVFELGRTDDGRYFIVMEHLSGIDLELLLRGAAQRSLRVPIWFSVQVVSDVLEALSFVHSLVDDEGRPRNVIHRDVTPSNIFVTHNGKVKLSDFGIADFAGKTPTTVAGQLKGKLAYMSPEQLNAKLLDRRADLFTCGVMLWEVLAQQRLFGQLNEMQAMLAICDDNRKPPSAFQPEVPPELDRVALKALAADRERRYQTAAEFQSDLLDCLHRLRGPVRSSDVKHVLQVLLGREEPDVETRPKPMTPARAKEPNASFLLKLDQSEREKLMGLKDEKDSSDVEEEDATLPMMRAVGTSDSMFWLRSPGGSAEGPLLYPQAHERLVEAGSEGHPISISIDQRHWMSLAQFAELSGQDLALDPTAPGSDISFVGSIQQRSMAAVFGLIARDHPTGTLSIANTELLQWYEIHLDQGRPTGVVTNVPSMQLPALLATKRRMKPAEIEKALHTVVRTATPLADEAMDRDAFLRERLVELFRWEQAEYTLQLSATARESSTAFAPSLLAILPALVDSACPAEELRSRLGGRLERSLERSWRFADAMEEMGLAAADRALVERLRSGKTIARSLEEQPALAKRLLVLAYVMLEADLLLELRER